jgi:hypothetical protein
MKGELLILFVILLLGLILCSFLGTKEGFTSGENTLTFMAPDGSKALVTVGDNIASNAVVTLVNGTIVNYNQSDSKQTTIGSSILYAEPNGGTALLTTAKSGISTFSTKNADGSNTIVYTSTTTDSASTTGTTNTGTTNTGTTNTGTTNTGTTNTSTMTSSTNYDNYNHYNGSAYPTIFYGPNGGTARVVETANSGTLVTTSSNGTTQIYYINRDSNDPTVTSYYGPNGGSAKIVTDQNGKKAVEITTPEGNKIVYSSDNMYQSSSTMNEYNPNTVTTGADYNNAFKATSYYGPNGGQVNTVMGPAGNTYASYDASAYYNSLPQGVPAHMIPPVQEDLYILKSQVVPPVCPACPEPIVQCPNNFDVTKCPPCPACQRCSEPSFECKKVPNYNAFNPDTMPIPVLNDFSSFGM